MLISILLGPIPRVLLAPSKRAIALFFLISITPLAAFLLTIPPRDTPATVIRKFLIRAIPAIVWIVIFVFRCKTQTTTYEPNCPSYLLLVEVLCVLCTLYAHHRAEFDLRHDHEWYVVVLNVATLWLAWHAYLMAVCFFLHVRGRMRVRYRLKYLLLVAPLVVCLLFLISVRWAEKPKAFQKMHVKISLVSSALSSVGGASLGLVLPVAVHSNRRVAILPLSIVVFVFWCVEHIIWVPYLASIGVVAVFSSSIVLVCADSEVQLSMNNSIANVNDATPCWRKFPKDVRLRDIVDANLKLQDGIVTSLAEQSKWKSVSSNLQPFFSEIITNHWIANITEGHSTNKGRSGDFLKRICELNCAAYVFVQTLEMLGMQSLAHSLYSSMMSQQKQPSMC